MNENIKIILLLCIVFGVLVTGSYILSVVVPEILPRRAPTEMVVNGEPCTGYYYYIETSSNKRESTSSLIVKCNNGVVYHNVTNLKIIGTKQ